MPEYEMGYEALLNWINLFEIVEEKVAIFWAKLAEIFYSFIKKRKAAELIKQWKILDLSLLPKNYIYYYYFYHFSVELFKGLNQKDLMIYFLEKKKEIFMKDCNYDASNLYNLATSFNEIENYENAKKYCIKCIRLFRHSSDCKILWYVIASCRELVKTYLGCKNHRKLKKIVYIVNKIVKSLGETHGLDEILLEFYIDVGDLENAHKLGWKVIRLYKKNRTNDLCSNSSYIYLLLSDIYRDMRDYKKSFQALANAKSCCGCLTMNDPLFFEIHYCLGLNYLNNRQHKNALDCFEYILSYSQDRNHLIKIKLLIVYAYYGMRNYDKALQYFIEIKDFLWDIPGMNNYMLFTIYLKIGQSYNFTKNTESANYYFCKTYELINQVEKNKLEDEDFSAIFSFFMETKDFDKCEALLQIKSIGLDSRSLTYKINLFIDLYLLYKIQNKTEEADKCWDKAEALLDIEKISLLPKKQIINSMLYSLQYMASVYKNHKNDFFNAVKIYKVTESVLDIKVLTHARDLVNLYVSLLYIYKQQNRLEEINEYSQKFLQLLKLADKDETFRQEIELSKTDIEKIIKSIHKSNLELNFGITEPIK